MRSSISVEIVEINLELTYITFYLFFLALLQHIYAMLLFLFKRERIF